MKKFCKLIAATEAAEILKDGMDVVLSLGKAADHVEVSTPGGKKLGYLAKDLSAVSSYTAAKEVAAKMKGKTPGSVKKQGRTWVIEVTLEDDVNRVYVPCGGNKAVFPNKALPTKFLSAEQKKLKEDAVAKRAFADAATGAGKAKAEAEAVEAEAKVAAIGRIGLVPLQMATGGHNVILLFQGGACCSPIDSTQPSFKEIADACKKQGIEVISSEQLAAILPKDLSTVSVSICSQTENYGWLVEFAIPNGDAAIADAAAPSMDLEDLMDGMASEDAEELTSRIVWLKKNAPKMPESILKAFVSRLAGHTGISPFKPTFVDNNGYVDQCVSSILMGMNIRLVGPAGCGKNRLVETLQSLFDVGISDMSFNADTNQDALLGVPTVTTNNEGVDANVVNNLFGRLLNVLDGRGEKPQNLNAAISAASESQPDTDWTPLLEAMKSDTAVIKFQLSDIMEKAQKPSLVNFDEVNMASASVTALLHSLTDHRRYITVPGYGTVNLHPEAFIVCTMNEEYAGTKELNRAFRDRFKTIRFQPSQTISQILKSEVPGLDAAAAKQLDTVYKRIQKDIGPSYDEDVLSLRSFIRAAQFRVAGYSIKESLLRGVVEDIDDVDARAALAAFVDSMK